MLAMADYRQMRPGSLSIPPSGNARSPIGPAPSHGRGGFEGPRSPPNTSHVPCKFFRQGACQAGAACPFSHDLGLASETICKYFAKGNCKFGPKCANIHLLSDGRRINYGKNGITIGQPMHRKNSTAAVYTGSSSALTTSFVRADAATSYAFSHSPGALDRQMDMAIPTIDATYSHSNSQYGSPREPGEDGMRLGLGAPSLTVLDTPLPASFDPNGMSHVARFPSAPWPSSMPSQFGLESPPSANAMGSTGVKKSDIVEQLHTSAFGSRKLADQFSPRAAATATSAQAVTRPLHLSSNYGMQSSQLGSSSLLSSSAPRVMAHPHRPLDDTDPTTEETLVPAELSDLLTPAEKARRASRADEEGGKARAMVGSGATAIPGVAIPKNSTTSKLSTSASSSPTGRGSRFHSFFPQKGEEEDSKKHAMATAGHFGHVGSPLFGPGPSHVGSPLRTDRTADFLAAHAASRAGGAEIVSALTAQLKRSRLDGSHDEVSLATLPAPTRPVNGRASERHVSSSSIGSRITTAIGEEDPDFLFRMDDDEPRRARKLTAGLITTSSIWGSSSHGAVAAGSKNGDSASRIVGGVAGQ